MTKKSLVLFTLIFIHLAAAAQKKMPKLGNIDKADLELKDCDFDKGAEAYVLIAHRSINYDRGVNTLKMVIQNRYRIKVLKEKGLGYADVKIPYYSKGNLERIHHVTAYTYNLDAGGNVVATEVDKKSIYTQQIDKNYSQLIIAFPEVKVGSIIEYRYTTDRESISYIQDWYFQKDIPVRYSQFDMKAPMVFHFSEDPFIYMKVDKKEDYNDELFAMSEGGVMRLKMLTKTYAMENIPGIHSEPYMSSPEDYKQRVGYQLAQIEYGDGTTKELRTTWKEVAKRLGEDEDFGEELRKSIPAAEPMVNAAVNGCKDSLCKMVKIFNAVKNTMTWNGDNSIYAMQGIRTAWEKKTGSVGDINFILINLLKKAGIAALPLLASTRSNGMLNLFFPSEKQFDVVMAYVELGDRYYILNAADKYNPYHLTPYNVVNTRGFLTDGDYSEWMVISTSGQRRQMTAIRADITAEGVMKGEAVVNSYEYAKNPRCKSWIENKEDFKSDYFSKPYTAMSIENLEVVNAANDTLALEQKVKFSSKLNSSGGYSYFTLNLFSGLESNPFVADDRISDVDFGYMQDYTIYGSFTIPENYVFEELPKNMSMIMPDTSIVFSRFLQTDENTLSIRITLNFKKPLYMAQNYPEFQDFYKKLFAKLNEQIVIKKK